MAFDLNIGHLQPGDLVAISIYGVVVIWIGLHVSRRQVSTEEYFVAGRGMGSMIVGISIIATLLSTISYLTTPGEMIKNGTAFTWGMLSTPISFAIVGYLVIPRIMKHKITSGYELLHERFGMTIRQTAAILFMLVRLIWMGYVIFTCSHAVAEISSIPLPLVLALVGSIGTVYTVLGGVRAVMITDVIQFVILFGGAVLTVGFITWKCDGLSWWPDFGEISTKLKWEKPEFITFSPFAQRITVASAIFNGCFFWIATATSDQVMIQRYLCTRNAPQARRSLLTGMLGDIAIMVVLFLVGIALLGYFTQFPGETADPTKSITEQADDLFPQFIGAVLPQGITGLLVAALFAAAMSSLDSGITAISSVLITDFKGIFARAVSDERAMVRRARWASLAIGIVAIIMSFTNFAVQAAFGDINLFELGGKISGFFIVPLFILFVMAFFVKFSTPAGAWAAIVVGFLAGVLFSYWKPLFDWWNGNNEALEFSFQWITISAAFFSIGAGMAVSLVTKPRAVSEAEDPGT